MARVTAPKAQPENNEPLEGQTAIDGEAQPPTQSQTVLYSKGDVAEKFGMTTQALANRATRDPNFPRPTYTNKNNTVELFTPEDVKKVGEYLLKPSEDIAKKIQAALKDL